MANLNFDEMPLNFYQFLISFQFSIELSLHASIKCNEQASNAQNMLDRRIRFCSLQFSWTGEYRFTQSLKI